MCVDHTSITFEPILKCHRLDYFKSFTDTIAKQKQKQMHLWVALVCIGKFIASTVLETVQHCAHRNFNINHLE